MILHLYKLFPGVKFDPNCKYATTDFDKEIKIEDLIKIHTYKWNDGKKHYSLDLYHPRRKSDRRYNRKFRKYLKEYISYSKSIKNEYENITVPVDTEALVTIPMTGRPSIDWANQYFTTDKSAMIHYIYSRIKCKDEDVWNSIRDLINKWDTSDTETKYIFHIIY